MKLIQIAYINRCSIYNIEKGETLIINYNETFYIEAILNRDEIIMDESYMKRIIFFSQPSDAQFSSQIMVYKDIGEEMLQHAFDGKSSLI